MRVPGPPIAVGNGAGNGALTGSETDERPEAMLLSRRIICILLPHRGAGRRSPTPTPNPSLSPSPRLRRPRRPAPPPPSRCGLAAARGGDLGSGGLGGRPWKLREASGVVAAGEPGERRAVKILGMEWEAEEGEGSLAAPLDFSLLFLAF